MTKRPHPMKDEGYGMSTSFSTIYAGVDELLSNMRPTWQDTPS